MLKMWSVQFISPLTQWPHWPAVMTYSLGGQQRGRLWPWEWGRRGGRRGGEGGTGNQATDAILLQVTVVMWFLIQPAAGRTGQHFVGYRGLRWQHKENGGPKVINLLIFSMKAWYWHQRLFWKHVCSVKALNKRIGKRTIQFTIICIFTTFISFNHITYKNGRLWNNRRTNI